MNPTETEHRRRQAARPRIGRRLRRRLAETFVIVACTFFILPVIFTLVTSMKPAAEARGNPFSIPSTIQWSNYRDAFHAMDYLRSLGNSMLLTAGASVTTVILGSLCAYALARYARTWTKAVYFAFGFGLTVPIFAMLTPLFLLMRDVGLLNSRVGVILIYTSLNLPLAVFFYTSFIRSIPMEIEEAARIDGCGPWQTFRLVTFPLLKPTTATLSIFVALGIWNDVIIPLVFFTDASKQTVVRSALAFVGTYTFNPAELFPAVVLALLPLLVVFIILQRRIIDGIASGAVRG